MYGGTCMISLVLAMSLMVGRQLGVSGGAWAAMRLSGGTPDPENMPNGMARVLHWGLTATNPACCRMQYHMDTRCNIVRWEGWEGLQDARLQDWMDCKMSD